MLCLKEKLFFFNYIIKENPNTQWHQQDLSWSDDRFSMRGTGRDTGHLYWGTRLKFLTTKVAWLKSMRVTPVGPRSLKLTVWEHYWPSWSQSPRRPLIYLRSQVYRTLRNPSLPWQLVNLTRYQNVYLFLRFISELEQWDWVFAIHTIEIHLLCKVRKCELPSV